MSAPQEPAILARGLCKSFDGTLVLDGVDVVVDEGAIFALLGPNGAGKTTIVRILTTLIEPDAGEVRVAGHDLRADPNGVRRAIGVTGQFSALDDLFTGEENLQLMADLNRLGRAAGAPPDRGAARAVRPARRGGPAGIDLLRRNAPAARPGDDPRRLAAGDLPRRADDRPRPA